MIVMASNGHLGVFQKICGPEASYTLFDADTATDTQEFGYEGDLVGWLHFYAKFTLMKISQRQVIIHKSIFMS